MSNILRGSRLVAAGLIAACTAISASVAIATAADATTAARVSTTAHVSTTGHVSTTAHSATAAGPARRGPSPAQLAMQEERAKVGAHAGLRSSGAITGSVTGFDGQPVAGACVTAVGAGRSVTTTAAPDGTFQLAGLPAGSYALEYRDCAAAGRYLTTWSGGAAVQSAAARVQVAAGQARHVPAMTLKPVNTVAAIAALQASFQRTVAANSRAISAAVAAKTGKISGTVTGNGKPLSGICVQASQAKTGRPAFGVKTAKNGTYTIRNVAPGQYHVIFAPVYACQGHRNWLQQVYRNDNNLFAAFTNGGTAVRVGAGHTTSGISGDLRLGGEISGTVTGKSGARARGICIAAEGKFPRGKTFGYFEQTAANGSYQLHALFPGRYTLHFAVGCGSRSENYAPATHSAVAVSLGQHVTVNQVMPTGASISGTVRLGSSSGKPLKGICVELSTAREPFGSLTSTNRDGAYHALGLTAGSYQLQVFPGCNNGGNYTSASLTVHATAGHQSTVNVVLQVGATISGTVTDSHGNPVPGICAEVVGGNTAGAYFGFDKNGSYSVDQISAGTYQVGFYGGCGNSGSYAPYWYQGQSSESTATPITLAASATFTANAVMQPGATITGKVINSRGNGQAGACVEASTLTDAELGPTFEAFAFTHNGTYTYTLANLAPGQYLISFGCPFGSETYAEQWYPNAPDAGAADLVSAPVGVTSGIDGVLQLAGSISGTVTGQGGHPLASVCVTAVNTKGTLPALRGSGTVSFASSGNFGRQTFTGANGYYRIKGLAPGRYRVSFAQCAGSARYPGQWYRGKASAASATEVTVRSRTITKGIGARLVLGGSVSGRVVNGSGKPLRNICVVAAAGSAGLAGAAVTGKAGTYTIAGLGSGHYTVQFSPCGSQNLITVTAPALVTAPHAATGVNATMHAGGSIAGNLTAGPAAVTGACVEVYNGSSADPAGFASTGADGSYVATGLPAGTYTVYFNDPQCLFPAPGLAPQWYNGQATQATATSVTVKVGATTGSVNAALQPDGQITGTVTTGSPATPLSGACVTAFPVSPNGSLPVTAVTGATGYTLAGILPGQYTVRFSAGCGAAGYTTQWWKDAATQKTATIITVTANQTASGISATLSKSS